MNHEVLGEFLQKKENQDSIKIVRNAKGEYCYEVKVYGDSVADSAGLKQRAFALEEAARKRVESLKAGTGTGPGAWNQVCEEDETEKVIGQDMKPCKDCSRPTARQSGKCDGCETGDVCA